MNRTLPLQITLRDFACCNCRPLVGAYTPVQTPFAEIGCRLADAVPPFPLCFLPVLSVSPNGIVLPGKVHGHYVRIAFVIPTVQ